MKIIAKQLETPEALMYLMIITNQFGFVKMSLFDNLDTAKSSIVDSLENDQNNRIMLYTYALQETVQYKLPQQKHLKLLDSTNN